MRRAAMAVVMALVGAGVADATPEFPGARRRAEPTGRWYATVESWSDRCALVERAPGSPPLDSLYDSGDYRAGLPGPSPVRPGDRVVTRARIQGYPWDLLPAPDGSGFAAVTQGYGPPGYPKGPTVELLTWVTATGRRTVVQLPEPTPPSEGFMGSNGASWRLTQILAGPVVLLEDCAGDTAAVRVVDGGVRRTRQDQGRGASPATQAFAEPSRLDVARAAIRAESSANRLRLLSDPAAPGVERVAALLSSSGDAGEVGQALAAAAMRGDSVLGLTPWERIPVVLDAYAILGPSVGPTLLGLLDEPECNVTDPERNVTRAAWWVLGSRSEGLALVRATLADVAQPTALRSKCAWLLSERTDETKALLAAITDADRDLARAAAQALADRRWAAGPEFLRLLEAGGVQEEVVATFFGSHVIPGSVPGLLRSLRRAASRSPLRTAYAKALETQTMIGGLGDDPDQWESAIRRAGLGDR